MKTGRDFENQQSPEEAWPSRPRRTGEGAASALEQLKQEHSEAVQPAGAPTSTFNGGDDQASPA